MTAYTLSVVQLCPDAYKAAANAIAEGSGYGTGNLSVELRHTDGSTWWGCHAWWMLSALATAYALPPEAPAEWHAAMAAVITHAVETKDMPTDERDATPMRNWQAALAANGLSLVGPVE